MATLLLQARLDTAEGQRRAGEAAAQAELRALALELQSEEGRSARLAEARDAAEAGRTAAGDELEEARGEARRRSVLEEEAAEALAASRREELQAAADAAAEAADAFRASEAALVASSRLELGR